MTEQTWAVRTTGMDGRPEYAEALGQIQAATVAAHLQKQGIPAKVVRVSLKACHGRKVDADAEHAAEQGVERLAPPKPGGLYYLAGPMSGYPDWNFPAFRKAAATLRRDYRLRILNPAETAGGDPSMEKPRYMRIDFGYLLASDGIILLEGWRDSDGAKRELLVADALGLPAWRFVDVDGEAWFDGPLNIYDFEVEVG